MEIQKINMYFNNVNEGMRMKHKICIIILIIMFCGLTITSCGGETVSDDLEAASSYSSAEIELYESEADEIQDTTLETDASDAASDESGDNAFTEEEQAAPETVAAYLSAVETLCKNYMNGDGSWYDLRALSQIQEVNLDKDYGREIIMAEDFAETGNFTFSLYVDGNPNNQNPDNLYVLEGNEDYVQIVFGYDYKIGDLLYIGSGISQAPPFALNLETKTLADCEKEYETVRKLFADWLQGQEEDINLHIEFIYPIAYVDGCLIYEAHIKETIDTDTMGMIYAAFDESRSLRAYLLVMADDI